MSDFPFPIYYPLFLSNNSCSWRTTIINYISSYSMSNLVQKHQRVIDLCSLQRDVPQCLCNSSHFPKGSTLRSHFFDLHCSNDSHTKDILQCFHRKIMKFVPMCSQFQLPCEINLVSHEAWQSQRHSVQMVLAFFSAKSFKNKELIET